MMPYLASILLVATTIMMLSFTTGSIIPSGIAGAIEQRRKIQQWHVQLIFMTSVIFHSYLIGIVAGKISEESSGRWVQAG
jgi:hypothetical protein